MLHTELSAQPDHPAQMQKVIRVESAAESRAPNSRPLGFLNQDYLVCRRCGGSVDTVIGCVASQAELEGVYQS
jgi:hypothetical protein